MKLLILGGTVFVGRHLVEAALARGHEVTLFNRGQHGTELFPEIEKLQGNRDGDLSALKGRRWDAAIDTCGYVPRIVRASAELLASSVDHYTFISSISVFGDFTKPGLDDNSPIGKIEDETVEEITGETYGPLKALCEQAAEQAMPGRVLNIRPGLIVGPHDPTDRFTYWPHRIAQGGEVLAPGKPYYPVQFIDVRDLTEWAIRMIEQKQTGFYSATGPDYTLPTQQLLEECRSVSHSDATFTWVSDEFLLEANLTPWGDLPLWIPVETETGAERVGLQTVNCRKAIAAGLTFRPLAETIRATLDWDATRPADVPRRAGINLEREQELLQRWHEQK